MADENKQNQQNENTNVFNLVDAEKVAGKAKDEIKGIGKKAGGFLSKIINFIGKKAKAGVQEVEKLGEQSIKLGEQGIKLGTQGVEKLGEQSINLGKQGIEKIKEGVSNSTNSQADVSEMNMNTTLEQDVEEQEKKEEERKRFSFDSVMSGVTGVLDKIEKKVEEKTGLDFDAPLKKREERLANEKAATQQAATNTDNTPNTETKVGNQDEAPAKEEEKKIS